MIFFLKGFIIDFKIFCLLYFMIVFKEYLEFLKLNMKKINDIFMVFFKFWLFIKIVFVFWYYYVNDIDEMYWIIF